MLLFHSQQKAALVIVILIILNSLLASLARQNKIFFNLRLC